MVHGEDQVTRAEHASTLLFGEDIASLPVEDVLSVFEDVPSTELPASDLGADGAGIVDLVAKTGLAPSKGEARRLVQSGGIYVNNRRVSDVQARFAKRDAIGGRVFVLRKGQKQNHLLKLL
jgi:tyrosyl-tRNA synthetase